MIGFITSFFNSYELSIPQIELTATVNINTQSLSFEGYTQFGKNVVLKNGASDIDMTVLLASETNFVASYIKTAIGSINFIAGAGTTLVLVDGTNKIDGAIGSTATLSRYNTTYYLRISNV